MRVADPADHCLFIYEQAQFDAVASVLMAPGGPFNAEGAAALERFLAFGLVLT